MNERAPVRRRHEAERVGARLPPLLVAADRVAVTVAQGVHGRRRVGVGESFWQFRPYQTGDATSAIDWRQSAKGDRVVLREQEWEAAQSVWLWVDRSASMRFRSHQGPTKHERAQVLALALASLLLRAGERVAALASATPPMAGRAALARLAEHLDQAPATGDDDALPRRPLPKHARCVLVSDWLMPRERIEDWLGFIHGLGVQAFVIAVLDPAELELPYAGRVRFTGMEEEGVAIIGNVDRVRADYEQLMAEHRAALADVTRRLGWRMTLHRTDHPPEQALLPAYMALGLR
jgi:uncharacterized protein (DUF58 family)